MCSKSENGIFTENYFPPEGASKPLKGKDTKGAKHIHQAAL